MSEVTAYIGLGSNLDEPAGQLEQALDAIAGLPATRLLACSSFYRSKALTTDPATPGPDYINAVAAIATSLEPLALLDDLQAIEQHQGRVRDGQRWAARTLDLDILLYGDARTSEPRLTVPHPEITRRDFVLVPLAEIAPGISLPGLGDIAQYIANCPPFILEKCQRSS